MQQKNFELLQKLQQHNPLPLTLLKPQNTPITKIPKPDYIPFNNQFDLKPSYSNLENFLFTCSPSFQNSPYFNFAKPQLHHLFSPVISTPHLLFHQNLFLQQFLSPSASLQSEDESKEVHGRDSPDISFEDSIKKKLKTEDAHAFPTQDCLKHEDDDINSINQIKQEEEQLIPLSHHSTKPLRSPQKNRWKNIPGHIMFAIKRGCKRCKEKPEGPQINSIKQKWDSLSEELKSKFWTFIQKYNRSWKTWTSIIHFISQEADQETIQILIELISELLSSKNKESFETWLSQTKISDETKESIKLGKKVFREEFIERIHQTQK